MFGLSNALGVVMTHPKGDESKWVPAYDPYFSDFGLVFTALLGIVGVYLVFSVIGAIVKKAKKDTEK